jgi:cytoskeletal protein RodZ
MLSMKRIRFALLTASLLFAGNLSVHAQSPQQSGDQTRPDSNSTKQPAKKGPDGVATPAKDNSKNSTPSTASTTATASSSTATAPQKSNAAKNAGMVSREYRVGRVS